MKTIKLETKCPECKSKDLAYYLDLEYYKCLDCKNTWKNGKK